MVESGVREVSSGLSFVSCSLALLPAESSISIPNMYYHKRSDFQRSASSSFLPSRS
jgi:hypothetical protein